MSLNSLRFKVYIFNKKEFELHCVRYSMAWIMCLCSILIKFSKHLHFLHINFDMVLTFIIRYGSCFLIPFSLHLKFSCENFHSPLRFTVNRRNSIFTVILLSNIFSKIYYLKFKKKVKNLKNSQKLQQGLLLC